MIEKLFNKKYKISNGVILFNLNLCTLKKNPDFSMSSTKKYSYKSLIDRDK